MGLTANTLSYSRGGRSLQRGLTFAVGPGEALMLRGPNGVGKTTLLRILAGLGRPDAGSVSFAGTLQKDRDAWSEIAVYGGHSDALKAQLTVGENLDFWAKIYGAPKAAAMAAFALDPIADRLAGACSAGQRRRLGLARLVLSKRPLWLLDEPSVSLDAASVAALSTAISAHLAGGGVAIIATHEPDLVSDARTLTLAPPEPADADTESDPFLAGDLS